MEAPGYSLAERDRRWALARQIMAAENVQALIAHGGHEHSGTAGFAPDAYFSNDRSGSVVIFCREADPVRLLVSSELPVHAGLEAAGRGETVWIDPAAGTTAGVAQVLREHQLERAAVGVLGPQDAHRGPAMGCPLLRDLRTELPAVTFKPVSQSFMFGAICQSPEELAVVGYCAAGGDATARAMLATAAPGVSEAEVYAAGMAAAFRRGCAASILISSGQGFVALTPPSWSYLPRPPRSLREGDVLLAEVISRFGMKETAHQVAIAIGDPHPDIETAATIARACYIEGLRAARVGNTTGDLAEAMLAPLKQAGSRPVGPLVRAVNPPWPARTTVADGGLPLAPGMTWALGPSAVIGEKAVSLGGTIIIGEDDPVELGAFTARLLRHRGAS